MPAVESFIFKMKNSSPLYRLINPTEYFKTTGLVHINAGEFDMNVFIKKMQAPVVSIDPTMRNAEYTKLTKIRAYFSTKWFVGKLNVKF